MSSYDSHFDGKRFCNVPDRSQAGFLDLLKWALTRDVGPWDEPSGSVYRAGPAPPAAVPAGRARVTFVNHATVLIQIDGLNILTDPIYAERASPLSWAGPRRARPPGIAYRDLPRIHAVLLSHNHYDHLCLGTLRRLHDRDQPDVYTGLRNSKTLQNAGFSRAIELDWWQDDSISDSVSVAFVPAQHFSGRGIFDRKKTLWGGFYLIGEKHRIYFAGDTGDGPHLDDIRERLGSPDLAVLPIGAYRPRYIMKPVHLSPEEAVDAHRRLGARRSMAVHFGTFPLADDGQWEPVERLDRAMDDAVLSRNDFWVLGFGEGRDLPTSNTAAE